MDFEYYSPPALVDEQKKKTTFKIIPIGGPEEIGKWREMQAAKETVYRMRLDTRDTRLAEFESTLGQKLDRGSTSGRSWTEKLDHVRAEKAELRKRQEAVNQAPPWEHFGPPKQNLIQKVISSFKTLWSQANF